MVTEPKGCSVRPGTRKCEDRSIYSITASCPLRVYGGSIPKCM